MDKGIVVVAVLALVMACPGVGRAQDKGYWRAASTQANKITGDIVISDGRLTINFTGYTLALIHKLSPAEMGAAFDADVGADFDIGGEFRGLMNDCSWMDFHRIPLSLKLK